MERQILRKRRGPPGYNFECGNGASTKKSRFSFLGCVYLKMGRMHVALCIVGKNFLWNYNLVFKRNRCPIRHVWNKFKSAFFSQKKVSLRKKTNIRITYIRMSLKTSPRPPSPFFLCPQKVAQSVKTICNEADVLVWISLLSLVWTCQKKKKPHFYSDHNQ